MDSDDPKQNREPQPEVSRRGILRRIASAGVLGAGLVAGGKQVAESRSTTDPSSEQAPAQGLPATLCSFPFHAGVYHGPSAGLELEGTLHLAIQPSGAVNGTLEEIGGGTIRVNGQVTGPTLTVLFDLQERLGPGWFISGIGTANGDIRECKFSHILGPLAGPTIEDLGAWTTDVSRRGKPGRGVIQ